MRRTLLTIAAIVLAAAALWAFLNYSVEEASAGRVVANPTE